MAEAAGAEEQLTSEPQKPSMLRQFELVEQVTSYDPDADEFAKWAHIDMSKPQGQVKQNVPPQCVSLKDSRRTIIICVFFLDTQDQLLFVA